jgi:hypothetical protein
MFRQEWAYVNYTIVRVNVGFGIHMTWVCHCYHMMYSNEILELRVTIEKSKVSLLMVAKETKEDRDQGGYSTICLLNNI